MIFKFLLLLLIAQVIYCQDRYQNQGGYQVGFQQPNRGNPEQGGFEQPNREPVSNNGDGYAQNYGQQNNYADLQNPLFNNANINNKQETSNSASLNQATFGTATINGRKRNAFHVKKLKNRSINDIKSDVLEIKNDIYGKNLQIINDIKSDVLKIKNGIYGKKRDAVNI